MITIHSSEFIMGAMSPAQFPPENLDEIAFAGRSNVGKSTLINFLLGRKNLARTSNTPGKTRQVNFYEINRKFRFADLPGYGYAKVSKQERDLWKKLIEPYLTGRKNLKAVVQLVDIRHPDMEADTLLAQYLFSNRLPYIIAVTKADKLSRNQIRAS